MLLVLGVTYIALGYGVGTRPAVPTEGAFLLYLPPAVLAVLWAGSGAVAVLAAWRRWDSAGWLALYVVPALYVLSYAGSWLLWQITVHLLPWLAWVLMIVTAPILPHDLDLGWWLIDPPFGDPRAWYNAVLRVPFIAIVLICSGWRETQHAKADR